MPISLRIRAIREVLHFSKSSFFHSDFSFGRCLKYKISLSKAHGKPCKIFFSSFCLRKHLGKLFELIKLLSDRVFTLTPSASSTDVTKGNDNVFQVCFSDPNQGSGSAVYMANNMADAKIAVIYRNDDAYSQGIRDTFVAEAENKGLEIVYEGTFTEDTQTDFNVQLTAAQSAGADTVFLPIYYQPASVMFNQAAQMGYAPTWFGVDGMDGILTMEGFGGALRQGACRPCTMYRQQIFRLSGKPGKPCNYLALRA